MTIAANLLAPNAPAANLSANHIANTAACAQCPTTKTLTQQKRSTKQRRTTLSTAKRRFFAKQSLLPLQRLFFLLRPRLGKRANVALYADSFGELPTLPIAQLCAYYGYTPFLPVITGKNLHFVAINGDFHANFSYSSIPHKIHPLGMLEPLGKRFHIDTIDLCFCPLLLADKNGVRIGMGGGFYDRTLANFHGIKVGFCYDFQIMSKLYPQPWDVAMDYLITPSKLYRC